VSVAAQLHGMRGGWRLFVLVVVTDVSVAGAVETVDETIAGMGGGPLVVVDVEGGETHEQRIGCLEPAAGGGWRLSVPWGITTPCKPEAKVQPHVFAELEDVECAAERCALPRPGTTFVTSLVIAVHREAANERRRVPATVNVLRHEPPYLFVAIETTVAGEVSARGVIRVKLYKKLADKVDETSWRRWRPFGSAAEGDL
jgi:hypothetical protein